MAAQTVPALVVVAVPSDGKVRFYNGSAGSVQLIADVPGYFNRADAPSGQGVFGVQSPVRLLDTRNGDGAPEGAIAARALSPSLSPLTAFRSGSLRSCRR